jgi:LPXTG-motif cell wall-anchored protein
MSIAGLKRSNSSPFRALVLVTAAAVALVATGGGTPAHAAIVPTVQLGTAAQYAVLGGSTVTNTGNTVMDASLGLYPGTSVTGFPPGQVNAPGVQEITSTAAQTAQSDLTAAFVDAANRPLDASTPADLVSQILVGGVYAGPSKSPLSLSGPLVLDGAGDPTSVFIFQTDSTLITASSSTVTLINGAQECNVFWLVGSSATLGTGSVFRGNILALDSITVTSGVTVYGRALARNAAVTLDNDTFVRPTCATTPTQGGATTLPGSATTTPGSATTTPGSATTTPGGASTLPGDVVTTQPGFDTATTLVTASTSPPPSFPGVTLPRTGPGSSTSNIFLVGVFAVLAGVLVTRIAGRRPVTGG